PIGTAHHQSEPPPASLKPNSQQQTDPPAVSIPQPLGPNRNLSTAPKPTLRQPRPSRPKLITDTSAQTENTINDISVKQPLRHASPKSTHPPHEIVYIPSQPVSPTVLQEPATRKPLTAQESFDFNISQEMDRIF